MCGSLYCRSLGAVLDGVLYHAIDSRSVPLGYTSVTVRVVRSVGRGVEVMMVAGSVGTKFEGKEAERGGGLCEYGGWVVDVFLKKAAEGSAS